MIAAERLKSKIQIQFFISSDNNPAENLCSASELPFTPPRLILLNH